MPRDELRQPLRKRSLKDRLWDKRPRPLALAAGLLATVLAGGSIWLSRLEHPLAGEPVVRAAIPSVEQIVTSSTTPIEEDPAAEEAASGNPEDIIDRSAAEIEVLDGAEDDAAAEPATDVASLAQEPMIYIAPHRPLKPAPVAEVTEQTEAGALPRVSVRGRKPFDVYSQATPLALATSKRPRITLVLGGMGLNAKLTEKAIRQLPGDVTLGFAPYGENLQAQVNKARAQGHEILLQVPMEPVGYPGTNPGPNTLLSDAPPQKNLEALRWHMSRFAGYSGITNYMGARLLVSEEALTPVMKEVKTRGLVYLEDATVNLTLSPKVAGEVRLPVQRAAVAIDAEPTKPAIAEALARLEAEARATGLAIGTGSGLDVTIETVAEWTKTLQEKGIILVPVSTAYKGSAG